jgi:hypothetical protein
MQGVSKVLKNAVVYIIYFLGMQNMYLLMLARHVSSALILSVFKLTI